MAQTIVIALGGNALIKRESLDTALVTIAEIVRRGFRVAITHGNGPQVGDLLIQQEEAKKLVPPMALDACVAMTQGQIGYLIQQGLQEKLRALNVEKPVVTVITQVLVAPADPAFHEPTKPIGPFYSEREMLELNAKSYVLRKVGRGAKPYRRVVASPRPLKIIEERCIQDLIESGHIVIACGGGGVPVIREDGRLRGVEAVVDKDLASALLACALRAEIFLILTGVERVALFFGTPQQINLERISLGEAKKHLAEGHFAPGSMGPKIEAAIHFLEHGGQQVIIAALEQAQQALEGKAGTQITK